MLSQLKNLFSSKRGELVTVGASQDYLKKCPWFELVLSNKRLRFRDPSVLVGEACLQASVKKDLRPFINLASRADFTYWGDYGSVTVYTVVWRIGAGSNKLAVQTQQPTGPRPAFCFSLQLLTPQGQDYEQYDNLLDTQQSEAWIQAYLQRSNTFLNSVSLRVDPQAGLEVTFADENVHQPVVADTSPVELQQRAGGVFHLQESIASERYFLALGGRDLAEFNFYTAPIWDGRSFPPGFAGLPRALMESVNVEQN